MSTFQRQLRKETRAVRHGIIKQMRKDLIYLLKPCPKYCPKFVWMWLLKKLLNLTPDQINLNK